ncbi:MAG TPA: hypothetical protein VI750_14770 [Pyrinomonadaceae bacterium]|nr:hypothetical protein [Pyrinomonadaceae bacterium]
MTNLLSISENPVKRRWTPIAFLFAFWALSAIQPSLLKAQDVSQVDPTAQGIINRAIEALGGSSYLNVRSVVGRGFYTAYKEGASQIPARFLDYIVYPDQERTEFTSGGVRVIQTNSGDTGWVFDGAVKTITDMTPEQIEDFKRSMRTSVENVLRGWWRKESATLSYIGRREAGLAKRNETVRLTYPNGFWIEYEFGAKDGLPAKAIYKRNRQNPDSGDMEEAIEEDRFAKPITIDGVTAPWVIDHFSNKVQTSRINYESIEYNQPVADALFAKPDNVKSIK